MLEDSHLRLRDHREASCRLRPAHPSNRESIPPPPLPPKAPRQKTAPAEAHSGTASHSAGSMQHPRRHKLTPPRAAYYRRCMNAVSPPLQPPLPGAPLPPTPPPSAVPAALAVWITPPPSCGTASVSKISRILRRGELPARGPNCPHRQSARSARKQFDSSPRPRSRHSAPSVSAPAAAPTTARKRTLPSAATPPPGCVALRAYRLIRPLATPRGL